MRKADKSRSHDLRVGPGFCLSIAALDRGIQSGSEQIMSQFDRTGRPADDADVIAPGDGTGTGRREMGQRE